jgi:hypothetical protein
MKRLFPVVLVFALGCKSTPATSSPATAPGSEYRNVQVFPRDMPREKLLAAMRGFTRGLGVRCDHCHVVTATEPKQEFDFPSDDKETKRAAREMIRLVAHINGTAMPRVREALGEKGEPEKEEDVAPVSCWTCHRGKAEPEVQPPPPPPAAH